MPLLETIDGFLPGVEVVRCRGFQKVSIVVRPVVLHDGYTHASSLGCKESLTRIFKNKTSVRGGRQGAQQPLNTPQDLA